MAELDELGLQARPSLIRRGTIACTGIEFCKLAIVETKQTATKAVIALEERLAGIDLPPPDLAPRQRLPPQLVRAHPDGRHRPQGTAPPPRRRRRQTPGFQVHLGGGLASKDREEAGTGRTVRGLKVTAAGLADYVERVVLRYLDERDAEASETFAEWAHRAEEEALQ